MLLEMMEPPELMEILELQDLRVHRVWQARELLQCKLNSKL